MNCDDSKVIKKISKMVRGNKENQDPILGMWEESQEARARQEVENISLRSQLALRDESRQHAHVANMVRAQPEEEFKSERPFFKFQIRGSERSK